MGSFASNDPSSECYALPKPGDVVADKYMVDRVLGSGGMATVFLATHVQLGGRVAIKCLSPHIAEKPEFLARFLEEARAAVGLHGEHSVRVFDVGVLDSGLPYIVMEYLRGCDLSQELDRSGALPIVEAVDYVLQVCEALAEAHRLGIVHRDLKPGNLFLAIGPDGGRRIKVLDFGVSKRIPNGSDSALRQNLTAPSTVLGSPQYMAPEQVRSARTVDARADIWSAGVVLFELLTDSCPFQGSTLAAIGATIVADQPISPRSLRGEIPEELAAIILRCLQKDPADRFQDVHELAMALAPLASPSGASVLERIGRISAAPAGHASPGPIKILLKSSEPNPKTPRTTPEAMAVTAAINNVDAVTFLGGESQTLLSPVPAPPVSHTHATAGSEERSRNRLWPALAVLALLLAALSMFVRANAVSEKAQVVETFDAQVAANTNGSASTAAKLGSQRPAVSSEQIVTPRAAPAISPSNPIAIITQAPSPKVPGEPAPRKRRLVVPRAHGAAVEPSAKAPPMEPPRVRALRPMDPLEDRK